MMKMRALGLALLTVLLASTASASWYSALYEKTKSWMPFSGTNDVNEAGETRLSTLMEPASLAIDEATDLLADGKTDEAVEKYRQALRFLEKLEVDYPERAASPEFQSVRNKRAYVDAQLNAILLEEARLNAKAVAVTDTSELEAKLKKKRTEEAEAKKTDDARKKGLAVADKDVPKLESQLGDYMKDERVRAKKITRAAAAAKFERESEEKIKQLFKEDPTSRKGRLMRAGLEIHRRNYGNARKDLDDLLVKNPNDVSALNLRAAIEVAEGNNDAARESLSQAIRADKTDYHSYYNLAKLLYQNHDETRAEGFYRQGRKVGGPIDPFLERAFE